MEQQERKKITAGRMVPELLEKGTCLSQLFHKGTIKSSYDKSNFDLNCQRSAVLSCNNITYTPILRISSTDGLYTSTVFFFKEQNDSYLLILPSLLNFSAIPSE